MMHSPSQSPPGPGTAQERRPVVVCIDDDPEILRAMRRLLRTDRFEVLTTSDPEEALDRILHPPVDVFIADERMPGITGTDLLRVVEQQSPQTRRVILSAYPEAAGHLRSESSVVQHFIPKPWNDDLLRAILRRMTAAPGPVTDVDEFMREIPILVECSGRRLVQIVPRFLKVLRRARREERPIVAVVEGLRGLKDDPSALLEDIELAVATSGVGVSLVDGSGMSARYRRIQEDPSPLMSVFGPDPARPPRRFLLVDPAAGRRVFLKLLLDGLGQSCCAVATAGEAQALLGGEPFERILVDLSAPDEMMDWIAEMHEAGHGVPVVPLLPERRHWDPSVFGRWDLEAPLIRPYSFRELLELAFQ